ncbi:hypothetical protein JXR01_00160 [Candidatus Kaiserbacteria bacterium]|nr:MAG: hypothetical protein JXR01_00160 [Candidatus Kaiserbacteria bacterium]
MTDEHMAALEVTDMPQMNYGLEALLDPTKNRRAQIESFFRFGLPTGLSVGGILSIPVFLLTANTDLVIFAGVAGFLLGLIWSFNGDGVVASYRNAVPTLFGSFDETHIGPSGWQFYWPQPFGSLFFQVAFGERQTNLQTVEEVETRDGVRFTVKFRVRRWFVRWPLPFIRTIESTRNVSAPERAMNELHEATIFTFINLHSGKEIFEMSSMNLLLADVLSGEVDEIQLSSDETNEDGSVKTVPFCFSGGQKGKSIRERLRQSGIFIPRGGVDVVDINEPNDVAAARAEAKEADIRGRTVRDRVKLVKKLQEKYPDVDVHRIIEDLMADGRTAAARMVIVRGDKTAGDFTSGAAVTTSDSKRDE